MYLLNAATTVEWVISPTATVIVNTDLDLRITDPEGTVTYVDSPIAAEDFTAPTVDTPGSASYDFTPDIEGLWKIQLVIGTANNYVVLSKVDFYVLDNTTTVNPFSPELGKPAPYDICFFMQGYMVADEIVGSYVASRDIVLAANAEFNIARARIAPDTQLQGFTILHNGLAIGTIDFDVGEEIGTITNIARLISRGDLIQIQVNSGSIDWTIRDVSVTLVGCSSIQDCELL